MDENLEFNNILREEKGALSACRLSFRQQQIIYKNIKTGKTIALQADQIKSISWQRFASSEGIRLMTKGGQLHRFDGFRKDDQPKVKRFIEQNYQLRLEDKEFSLNGFNWGVPKFEGEALSFDDEGNKTAFEVPLSAVSDCTANKNEVIMSFHHNDDATVGITDMRLYLPPGKTEEDIKEFMKNILNQASVIKVTGQSIATFTELQCLTPRGRYDMKLFPSLIQLHGKTFDYKIPVNTVLRLFKLPHKDGRQMFFVLSLDPPVVQGQTRYQFLQFLFPLDEEESIELDMPEDELERKFEGKLKKTMSGTFVDIFANVVKAITNKKVNMPDYKNPTHSAITCSYKNNNGLLYPLERGFMYVHKPAIHVRFEEIISINFARSDGSTRSFDFEIETKSNSTHVFNSIEKDEYGRMWEFVTNKKLRVKNRPTQTVAPDIIDELVDSDDEDAYLHRVRNEGAAREAGEEDSEEDDEDFDPNAAGSDDEPESGDSGDAEDDDDEDDDEFDSGSDASEPTPKKKKTTAAKKPAKEKAPAKKAAPAKKSEPKKKAAPSSSKKAVESPSKKAKSREFIDDDFDSSSGDD